eukprot:9496120-Pyramimonas_sp.AAC.1
MPAKIWSLGVAVRLHSEAVSFTKCARIRTDQRHFMTTLGPFVKRSGAKRPPDDRDVGPGAASGRRVSARGKAIASAAPKASRATKTSAATSASEISWKCGFICKPKYADMFAPPLCKTWELRKTICKIRIVGDTIYPLRYSRVDGKPSCIAYVGEE